MRNNPMQMIQMLMQQGNGNPQMIAQQLLRQNPQFAKAIQGQNPEVLAKQVAQNQGVDLNQMLSMFNRR